VIFGFDLNRGHAARFSKIFAHLTVIDWFIHADVEQLLSSLGMVNGGQDGAD
jgi:hypothetical protein